MAQVPETFTVKIGDGVSTQFSFDFPYLHSNDVFVEVDEVPVGFTYTTGNTVTLNSAPAVGAVVYLYRSTPAEQPAYDFQLGAPFLPAFIDENFRQLLYAVQEGIARTSEVERQALRVPDNAGIPALPGGAMRAGKLLSFDAAGNPVVQYPSSDSAEAVSAALATVQYAENLEITDPVQIVQDGGSYWRVAPDTALPYTTTGAGLPEGGAFVAVGDTVLRQELAGTLASGQGANLVNGATIYVGSVAELAALPSPISGQEALVHGVPFKRINLTWIPSQGYVTPQVYGGSAEVGKDNASFINDALANNPYVVVPAGVWEIGSALRIPSNTTLEFHPSAELKLQDGASDYLITNDDLVNGDDSIRVIGNGATINGNKPGIQTRNYGAPADDRASYWGFGMWFSRVTNLVVDGFYVLETESWGVGYWDVNNGYFGNLRFWQTSDAVDNGDGVTGVGSHLLIENISGYTNDDMVFVGNGGGTLQGNDMGMADLPSVENITIRNIRPEARDGIASLRAIRISGRSPDGGTTPGRVFGVTVENVRGKTRDSIIDIANYWQDTHPGLTLYKIKIDGLEREIFPESVSLTEPHISIDDSFISDLTISNWRAFESSEIPNFLVQGTGSRIESLFVSDCESRDETSRVRVLISQSGQIDYAVLTNILHKRRVPGQTGQGNGHIFYKQAAADAGAKTRVSINNARVQLVDGTDTGPGAVSSAGGGTNIAVRGISDRTDLLRLTPDPGDTIIDSNDNALKTYNGTGWV